MSTKGVIFSILAVCLFALAACHKQRDHRATIIRNCTGVYLHWKGKNYHVCNIEKTASYVDGSMVNVRFRKINECPAESEKIVCLMAYDSEGWVEVTAVE